MSNKLQELFKKYGKIGIGVHLSIYAATLAGEPCPICHPAKLESFAFFLWLIMVVDVESEHVHRKPMRMLCRLLLCR